MSAANKKRKASDACSTSNAEQKARAPDQKIDVVMRELYEVMKQEILADLKLEAWYKGPRNLIAQQLRQELRGSVVKSLERDLRQDYGWMEELKHNLELEVYDEVRYKLEEELTDEIRAEIVDEMGSELEAEVEEEVRDRLEEQLSEKLEPELRQALKERVRKDLREELVHFGTFEKNVDAVAKCRSCKQRRYQQYEQKEQAHNDDKEGSRAAMCSRCGRAICNECSQFCFELELAESSIQLCANCVYDDEFLTRRELAVTHGS